MLSTLFSATGSLREHGKKAHCFDETGWPASCWIMPLYNSHMVLTLQTYITVMFFWACPESALGSLSYTTITHPAELSVQSRNSFPCLFKYTLHISTQNIIVCFFLYGKLFICCDKYIMGDEVLSFIIALVSMTKTEARRYIVGTYLMISFVTSLFICLFFITSN